MSTPRHALSLLALAAFAAGACGGDDNQGYYGNEADYLGVGAQCSNDTDCFQQADGGIQSNCLTQFKGGYCGIQDCRGNLDCPQGSACVIHDDGVQYCFRQCLNKAECNRNRSAANASNCSSNVTYVEPNATSGKSCVPPSG